MKYRTVVVALLFSSIIVSISGLAITDSGKLASQIDYYDYYNNQQLDQSTDFSQSSPSTNLNIGLFGDYSLSEVNLDPLQPSLQDALLIQSLMYNTLVEFDPITQEMKPSLAKSWIVTKDSKTWIFFLRKNVYFHDGTLLTSSLVKDNFDRLLNPDNPAYVEDEYFDSSFSVEVLNNHKIAFHLNESDSNFLSGRISLVEIVSPNSFNETGEFLEPIGTGPYIFNIDQCTNYSLYFSRFNDCFKGVAPFEGINVTFVQSLDYSEYDFYRTVPFDFYGTEGYEYLLDFANAEMLGFFNYDNPILQNRLVRLAINHAINQEDFVSIPVNETFYYEKSPKANLLCPGTMYRKDSIPGYMFNRAYANELLDLAGYSVQEDGYRFTLEFLPVFSSFYEIENQNAIIGYLEDVGIKLNNNLDNWTENSIRFFDRDYDIALTKTIATNDPYGDLGWYLHSESIDNPGYYNSTFEELFDQAKKTPIDQEREYYFYRMQDIIQDDAPYILLSDINPGYAIKLEFTSFVFLKRFSSIDFNFTNGLSKFVIYEDVPVEEDPLYFANSDILLENSNQIPLNFDIAMSYDTKSLISSSTRNETGKVFYFNVDQNQLKYSIRCYYDPDEINFTSPNDLKIYQLDIKDQEWIEMDVIKSDSIFRYLELELSGDIVLLLTEDLFKDITRITYVLLPFVTLFVVGAFFTTTSMIIFNIKESKKIMEMCEL
ncbi:MAG: hypothetical protein FK730_00070 [Asgard group archaeon]|nr:hypothetical protein [Asgard group archaeon]